MENIDIALIGKYIKSTRLSKGWSQSKLEKSQSGYLSAIGDECYEAEKSQIYIHNYELINIYHRLTPIQQQEFVQEIKKLVSQSDLAKQQKMFRKKP